MTTTTKDKVRELIENGFTVLEVARHLNISPQAVYKHIHKNGIPLPTETNNEGEQRGNESQR